MYNLLEEKSCEDRGHDLEYHKDLSQDDIFRSNPFVWIKINPKQTFENINDDLYH